MNVDPQHVTGTDAANMVVAVGAATSPWWLPLLRESSEIAAMVVPILGVMWLLLQIVLRLHSHFHRKPPIDTDL